MRTSSLTINPQPPANPGLDYAFLKAEGTDLVQRLAGEIWTDYNESDPGVTILEQLCYALTELSYRAELPLEDLLIGRDAGKIDPRRQALFPARRIFPCNPVTEKDYRKLLIDRIPEIANVWLQPHRVRDSARGVDGLYDLELYVPGLEPPPCGPVEREDEIRDRVRRVYCRHRELCEDLRSIRVLRPVRAVVHAEVSLTEMRTPDAILAGILFNLGHFFAPEPRRQSLRSLLDAGVPPSEIFNGPLLLHGFIADGELQPRAKEIPVPDVVRVIARSVGAAGVRNVKVRVGGETYQGNDVIPVPRGSLLSLDTRGDGKRGFTIKLFKNGIEIAPNAARVQRELDKLWASQRRTWPLAVQYNEFFGFPEGRYRDVERYYSIQNQFPNVYGINAYGLPSGASEVRKSQAKQLKGYLLVFDQLLADFFAQLAHVRDLYSTEKDLASTYFYQYLDRSVPNIVPNIEPLLKHGPDGYRQGLPAIVGSQAPVVERRNRFLSFLLALYAEELDADSIWDLETSDEEDPDTAARLLRARLALLRHLTASTHNRGRGFDYLERPSRGNLAGMEIKSRIQLGMPVFDQRPFAELLDELGVELAAGGKEAPSARPLRRHTEVIEEQFTPVPLRRGERQPSLSPAQLPHGFTVPEELLGGGEVEEMRVGTLPGETAVAAVWKSAGDEDWRLLGKYPDRESARAACCCLADLLGQLGRHSRQLYVVEHTLLRFGRFRKPDDPFVYSFTITAVIAVPPRLRNDGDYRRFACEVIRDNTPAHVVVDYLFLRPGDLRRFENLYGAWRRALRKRNRREIIDTSTSLRRFLQDHQD